MNEIIETWKEGILDLIFQKTAQEYVGEAAETVHPRFRGVVGPLISAVRRTITRMIDKVADNATREAMRLFLKNNAIRIYLDDLDRGWEAKHSDIRNLSALLNAIRDLCGSQSNLQFRLGLRNDVYHLVRTSDESTLSARSASSAAPLATIEANA